MIALDFYSGSHGHFLEYLINTYILKGPRVSGIFTELGTSHNIRKDPDYMNFRLVEAAHYSEFDIPTLLVPEKVIRISANSTMEQVCYQINVFCRAGDIPAENKLLQIADHIRFNNVSLRNNFYSKLKNDGYKTPGQWKWNEIDSFVFPMAALYDLTELYRTLYKLSKFLDHSFNPDDSLSLLWKDFILKNQGLSYWIQTNDLLKKILLNTDFDFESDAWTQALLNYLLSDTIGINDSVLHHHNKYPSNTSEIYQLIQNHIAMFDQRF
jgi:hypothetical protein